MLSLIYVSQATDRFTQPQLVDLLTVCHQNNAATEVTGLLLYNGRGTFLQALEGNEDKVNSLYEKIKQDPRHTRVNQIAIKRVSERTFPHWKMGFRHLDLVDNKKLPGFTDFMQQNSPSEYLATHQNFSFNLINYFKDQTEELIFK